MQSEKDISLNHNLFEGSKPAVSEGFCPLRAGEALRKLKSEGYTFKKMREISGLSSPHITRLINLTQLDPKIYDEIDEGNLCMTTAAHIGGLKIPSTDKLRELHEDFSSIYDIPDLPEDLYTETGRRHIVQNIFLIAIKEEGFDSVKTSRFISIYNKAITEGGSKEKMSYFRTSRESNTRTYRRLLRELELCELMGLTPSKLRRKYVDFDSKQMGSTLELTRRAIGNLKVMERRLSKLYAEKT